MVTREQLRNLALSAGFDEMRINCYLDEAKIYDERRQEWSPAYEMFNNVGNALLDMLEWTEFDLGVPSC